MSEFTVYESLATFINVIKGNLTFKTVVKLNTKLKYKLSVNAINDLLQIKGTFQNNFKYKAYLEYIINKLENIYLEEVSLDKWLSEYKTTTDEVLTLEYDDYIEDNLLSLILQTDLLLKAQIAKDFKLSHKDNFGDLSHLDITEIMLIQNAFSIFIRETYKNLLIRYFQNIHDSIVKTDNENEQEHEHIFSNNGFSLFNYIIENFITEKRGRDTDISYYYRKMYADKFIRVKPVPFQDWFNDHYNENIQKIKTLNDIKVDDRKLHYARALDWFKHIK